ncbi:MAG TPA: DUF2252 domain-containing protein [Solirubrobacteraceae bacterium]|nr:DUF2252 domain-containing protein [Solirubrobacteraceae bacterium]
MTVTAHPDPGARQGPICTPRASHAVLQSGESVERGRAARAAVPRAAHGEWAPAADRPDPIAVLQHQAATRLQDLVPIRYGRMLVSPFTFYRGAAAVMAADLASTRDSGIVVQACGDAHISNFGGFAAQDRRLLFGPNDFDETLPGPWEWDVKRMAASVEIAGRDVELPARRRRLLVTECLREYRLGMRSFADESHLQVWYDRLDANELVDRFGGRLDKKGRILFARPFARARHKTSLRAVTKLTERVGGELRFRRVPPLLVPLSDLVDPADVRQDTDIVRAALDAYTASLDEDRRYLLGTYRFVDMARKVVGVGSVGTRAWVLLFAGRDGRDPLVLQMKEAQPSVLEPYLGASVFENHGERVVRGQRLSQAAIDVFLGWQRSVGLDGLEHDFYIRQLWDWKASIDLSTMDESGLHAYTRACGWSLARAHARSGDRVAIAAYLGSGAKFDQAIARFAAAYADQNDLDYERLAEAVASGEVSAVTGV